MNNIDLSCQSFQPLRDDPVVQRKRALRTYRFIWNAQLAVSQSGLDDSFWWKFPGDIAPGKTMTLAPALSSPFTCCHAVWQMRAAPNL